MKNLSFGDTHIGAGCDDDVRSSCSHIISQAKVIRPDFIIHTGDVFEGESTIENRNQARDMFTEMGDICPVLVIKGNHDIKKDLDIFRSIRANHRIRVFETPGVITIAPGVHLHILPWLTKAAWIAGNVGIDAGIQQGDEAVSLLALEYLKIQIAKTGEGKHLIYAHLMISGSKAENHQPLLGEGITFGYHDLVEAGFCGGAFGHIHLAQTFGDRAAGSPEFRYNGAVAAMNYGESSSDKKFSVLDTDTLEVTEYPIASVPRLTFDAEWKGESGMSFGETIPDVGCEGARVRVKLLVEDGYSAEDGREFIRKYFSDIKPLELKIEIQKKPRDLVRAQEIASAKTAQEKLLAYWDATKSTPEEPMRTDMLLATSKIEQECSTIK